MTGTVLLLAAENGALAGGKVGGVGDVTRELPPALAQAGWQVIVMSPGYGILGNAEGFVAKGDVSGTFAGQKIVAEVRGAETEAKVTNLVIEHPLLTGQQPGTIYIDDADQPYASDANRFALFALLVADWLKSHPDIDVIHLHDWHTTPLLLLKAGTEFSHLSNYRYVYTIHNLAYQGVRPITGNPSSLNSWYPGLKPPSEVIDPRWQDCINLMRVGIRLADAVNTVSPRYAREITLSDDPMMGRFGGAGLESDLNRLAVEQRLLGILNGCSYPARIPGNTLTTEQLLTTTEQALKQLMAARPTVSSAHWLTMDKLRHLDLASGQLIVTSVGRLTEQKFGLLREPVRGRPALHHLLEYMADDGVFVLLGAGDANLVRFLNETSVKFSNLLFVEGFEPDLADDLYKTGRLFVMPSSFEPCGIGQLMAMRAGQPCLAHSVGGLRDTVKPGRNGWTFGGDSPKDQATGLVRTFKTAFSAAANMTNEYQQYRAAARQERFSWERAAEIYINALYSAG